MVDAVSSQRFPLFTRTDRCERRLIFITADDLTEAGYRKAGLSMKLNVNFDAKDFKVTIESKTLTDPRLQHAWSDHLNRILLTAKSHKLKGRYRLSFEAL